MPLPLLAIPAAIAGAKAIGGAIQSGIANRKLKKLEKNRPKYQIASEYGDNQALAKNAAFGRNRAVQSAERNIQQSTANAIDAAQQSSSSGSGTLAAIAAMQSQNNAAYDNLSANEAQMQAAARGELANANTAMAEEKDKAFDYNVNQPYQNKVAKFRDKQKRGTELMDQGIDMAASMAMQMGGSGGGIGKMGGRRAGSLNASMYDPRNVMS